jgi:hypothetical protein
MEEQRPRAADDFATIRARMEEITERRPRAADDFAAIRARLTELRRERERAEKAARGADEERLDERGWPISVKRARAFSEF